MSVAGIIVGCLLLGQTPAAHAVRPPEMAAEAIRLPTTTGALTGQPLHLVAALETGTDRRQQLDVVQAYWRLVNAVAEYRYSSDYLDGLAQIALRGNDDAAMRSCLAAAAAQLRAAELDAIRAQHDLAGLMRSPAGAALPLPADPPHVGPYRTAFNELFADRAPPETARLADRLLPIERVVVDDRAAAVQAAEDALAAVVEDYQTGRNDIAAVTSCSAELFHARQAFIRVVCDYNRDIADYSLAVLGPATPPQALADSLIGPPQPAAAAVAPSTAEAVRVPERIARNAPTPAPPRVKTEPTLAPPLTPAEATPAPPAKTEPTPAPPKSEPTPAPPKTEPTPAPPRDRWSRNAPTPRNDKKSSGKDDPPPTKPSDAGEPQLGEPNPSSSQSRTANKLAPYEELAAQPATAKAAAASSSSLLYPTLASASPAVRTKELTAALHADEKLAQELGRPIGLLDCMIRNTNSDRQTTINAYWLVWRRTAHYKNLAATEGLLGELGPVVLDRRNTPSGAADMLRLHAARLAAKAAVGECKASLVKAQYALAVRIGVVADPVWPLAATLPHAGGYLLKLDVQPATVTDSWAVRRLAATVPSLGENVRQRAAAVAEADVARVASVEKYRAGTAAIDHVLDALAAQTNQTTAFADSLADYNRAIAEYAILVLPPAVAAEKLVAALVVTP